MEEDGDKPEVFTLLDKWPPELVSREKKKKPQRMGWQKNIVRYSSDSGVIINPLIKPHGK